MLSSVSCLTVNPRSLLSYWHRCVVEPSLCYCNHLCHHHHSLIVPHIMLYWVLRFYCMLCVAVMARAWWWHEANKSSLQICILADWSVQQNTGMSTHSYHRWLVWATVKKFSRKISLWLPTNIGPFIFTVITIIEYRSMPLKSILSF